LARIGVQIGAPLAVGDGHSGSGKLSPEIGGEKR
jgi:hypothetical protein